jgi:adenylate kinase family enzyme
VTEHYHADENETKLVIERVTQKLSSAECKERGWIMEEFPATKTTALSIQTIGILPDKCIVLDVAEESLKKRMEEKGIKPGSAQYEKFLRNYQFYQKNVKGLLECYASSVCHVDADGTAEETLEAVKKILGHSPLSRSASRSST